MQYGEGGRYSVTMDGPFGNTSSATRLRSISALKNAWKGGESPYSQTIEVDGFSVKSKIDIQLTVDQMETFRDQVIAFTVVNNKGVITLYAIGDKPANDCVFQVTSTEIVTDNDVIIGNAVSTVQNRADYNQNDSTKADFILNRPIEAMQKAQRTADKAKQIAENALSTNGGIINGNVEINGNITIKDKTISGLANPVTETDATNKKYVDGTVISAAFPSSGWSDAAPYTQTVNVEGITVNDNPDYWVIYSGTNDEQIAQKEAFAVVDKLETADGFVTVTCLEDKPTTDITIGMEVHR